MPTHLQSNAPGARVQNMVQGWCKPYLFMALPHLLLSLQAALVHRQAVQAWSIILSGAPADARCEEIMHFCIVTKLLGMARVMCEIYLLAVFMQERCLMCSCS